VAEPNGPQRIVRAPHNTAVALLYRHGLPIGAGLLLFLSLYGLRSNIRDIAETVSIEWRVLLIGLVAYRLAAIVLAQFHQGLFDDPFVMMSIAAGVVARKH
jgi:hypothetical protein